MTRKSKSFVSAKQNIADSKRFVRYAQARMGATADEIAIDAHTLSELVHLLKWFDNMTERAKTVPDERIKKMLQAQFEKLPRLIQSMINIWGMTELIQRCEHTVKIDTYRPRNMPILDFVASPDLYNIGGKFSTFDPKLGRKYIQNMTVGQVKEYMNTNIPTRQAVAREIANATIRALDKNIETRKDLVVNADLLTYSLYFQKIANDMAQDLCLPGKAPWVTFVDSWKFLPGAPENLLGISGGHEDPYIILNLKNLAKKAEIDTTTPGLFLFLEVCEAFAHEFTHFVDRHHPNRGALGAQKSVLSDKIYDRNPKAHDINPNEKIPLLTGDIVKQGIITGMLNRR